MPIKRCGSSAGRGTSSPWATSAPHATLVKHIARQEIDLRTSEGMEHERCVVYLLTSETGHQDADTRWHAAAWRAAAGMMGRSVDRHAPATPAASAAPAARAGNRG